MNTEASIHKCVGLFSVCYTDVTYTPKTVTLKYGIREGIIVLYS